MVCKVRDNLTHSVLEELNMGGESWLGMRIGKGKKTWCLGNYYREHRKLDMPVSETESEQVSRFEGFMTRTKRAMMFGNVAVMGDFNKNLDPTSTVSSTIALRLKDKLLDTFPLAGLV